MRLLALGSATVGVGLCLAAGWAGVADVTQAQADAAVSPICPPVVSSWPLPPPADPDSIVTPRQAMVPAGGKLYLFGGVPGLEILDLATGTTTISNALPNSTQGGVVAAAYLPSSNKVVAVVGDVGDEIWRYDVATGTAAESTGAHGRLPGASHVSGAAADDPNERVFLAYRGADPSTGSPLSGVGVYAPGADSFTSVVDVTARYGAGISPKDVAFDAAANRLFVDYEGSSSANQAGIGYVEAFDGTTGASVAQYPLADVHGLAYDASAHRLYALTGSGAGAGVAVIDTTVGADPATAVSPAPVTDPNLAGRVAATDFVDSRFWLDTDVGNATKIVEVSTTMRSVRTAFTSGTDIGLGLWDPVGQRFYADVTTPGSGIESIAAFQPVAGCPYDQTPPTVAVTAPADGATYALNQNVTADFQIGDPAGGLGLGQSQVFWFGPGGGGTLAPGDRLPASVAGSYTVEFRLEDLAGNAVTRDVHYTVVASNPDGDGDGVADAIETTPGVFTDGTTFGSVTSTGGNSFLVEDASSSAEGVHIVVNGSGSNETVFSVCGFATLRLLPGSDVVVTCGSVRVRVSSGSARIVVGGGLDVVGVPAGGDAKVTSTGAGTYGVQNFGGVPVSVTVDGVQGGAIAPGATAQVAGWHFVGFAQPVDNNGVLNTAKAGRVVPLKWQILDAANRPVTNLAGAKISTTSLGCSTGAPTDDIELYAAGSSGLQNLGSGNYQLNWQTPAGYANSCKTLLLDIGDGVVHRALFKFTK